MPCRSSRICSGDAFRFPTIGSGKFSWVLFSDQNRHHAGLLLDEDPHLIRIKLNPCSIRLHGALRLLAEIHQRRHQIVFLFPANGQHCLVPAVQRLYPGIGGKAGARTHLTQLLDALPYGMLRRSVLPAQRSVAPVKAGPMEVAAVLRKTCIHYVK